MQRDLRQTRLYREAESLFRIMGQPGGGHISDAAELHVSPVSDHAVFTASVLDHLEGPPLTKICQIQLTTGESRLLTSGHHTDRSPKYSPDGRWIAFLSDRSGMGNSQLFVLDPVTGATRCTPMVSGWIEYIHWSPDGRHILLAVAEHGADVAGVQGAISSTRITERLPSWMPTLTVGQEGCGWRRLWVYNLADNRSWPIGPEGPNIWEAGWCGNERVVAVTSPGPREGLWYTASLELICIQTGANQLLYRPRDQLGWPSAAPSGRCIAVVEAICSDRWAVAGDLILIETATKVTRRVDTHGVDVTFTQWCSESMLLLAGHRGSETVVGTFDSTSGTFAETWRSCELTGSGRYVALSSLSIQGDCALVSEGFTRAPEIGVIRRGQYRTVRSLSGSEHFALPLRDVRAVTWSAPDGWEIEGWLLMPDGRAPFPLITCIHGGPVAQWRPHWLGRRRIDLLMLLSRGYGVFLPNPRGSSGRGQEFARSVVGDMGGRDSVDIITGIDYLIEAGIADPARLGVTGVSYGGFMAAWLITQHQRFAAAVSISPVTNWITEHLLSNVSDWVASFMTDSRSDLGGSFFQRSPISHADRASTPTLLICGALDRCTPAEEASQFHQALVQKGIESQLVIYPEEGHGIRQFPAIIDCAARIVGWFEEHLQPRPEKRAPSS